MSSTISSEAIPSTTDRATSGRFAVGNASGPGNPFARQTAALRAYLVNHVTERDLQDILDILLLNAKGGHLPTIKFLFSYVLGKPKPVVEPDLLDLQEMQMMQQAAQAPEGLATMCDQLPLNFQVELTRCAQAENVATAVKTAQDGAPAGTPPSPNRVVDEPRRPARVYAPTPNGVFGAAEVATGKNPPSTNGKMQQPPPSAGFDWLIEWRRAFDSLSPP